MKPILKITAVALVACHSLEAQDISAADKPPIPPSQNTPWAMPESMSDPHGDIAGIVRHLFDAGMPDPRALPYHHVTVNEGGRILQARGWLLPAGQKQRYAIGWSGMIYPVAEVAGAADLNADIEILRNKGRFHPSPFDNYREESLGDVIAKFQGGPRMMHTHAAPYLLLRLGHPITVMGKNVDPFAESAGMTGPHEWWIPDYASEAISQLAKITRDDGVAAWIDGDFATAAMRLNQFDKLWKEAEIRSPKNVPDDADLDPFAPGPPTLDQLNSAWREILIDGKRRLSPKQNSEKSAIEQAIASWDQVDEWSDEIPPPSFRMVVASGPLAIKPLLKCLENDQRWTRVIKRSEGEIEGFQMWRVRDLAIEALNRILHFTFEYPRYGSTPVESEWYDDVAKKYITLCERYDYQYGPELWFRILQSPESDLKDQLTATELMVTPISERSNPYFHIFSAAEPFSCCESAEITKPAEELRNRKNPSVIELMTQVWQRERDRVDKISENEESKTQFPLFVCGLSQPTFLHSQAHHVVHCLEDWSPGNTGILIVHYRWLRKELEQAWEKDNGYDYHLLNMCEETLIRRFWACEQVVDSDFKELFRASLQHGRIPFNYLAVADEPHDMDALVKEAFLGRKAPLNLIHRAWKRYDTRSDYVAWDSPLLKFPSFRKALIEALQTTEVQATLLLSEENPKLQFHANGKEETEELYSQRRLRKDSNDGKSTIDIRVCDLIAYHLTPETHDSRATAWVTPDFRIGDPKPARDKAINDWIERIKSYH